MKGKNVMKNKISGKIVALFLTLILVSTSGMPLYAKETGDVTICVECVNRFETHFLNIAEDAVKFC